MSFWKLNLAQLPDGDNKHHCSCMNKCFASIARTNFFRQTLDPEPFYFYISSSWVNKFLSFFFANLEIKKNSKRNIINRKMRDKTTADVDKSFNSIYELRRNLKPSWMKKKASWMFDSYRTLWPIVKGAKNSQKTRFSLIPHCERHLCELSAETEDSKTCRHTICSFKFRNWDKTNISTFQGKMHIYETNEFLFWFFFFTIESKRD